MYPVSCSFFSQPRTFAFDENISCLSPLPSSHISRLSLFFNPPLFPHNTDASLEKTAPNISKTTGTTRHINLSKAFIQN